LIPLSGRLKGLIANISDESTRRSIEEVLKKTTTSEDIDNYMLTRSFSFSAVNEDGELGEEQEFIISSIRPTDRVAGDEPAIRPPGRRPPPKDPR